MTRSPQRHPDRVEAVTTLPISTGCSRSGRELLIALRRYPGPLSRRLCAPTVRTGARCAGAASRTFAKLVPEWGHTNGARTFSSPHDVILVNRDAG